MHRPPKLANKIDGSVLFSLKGLESAFLHFSPIPFRFLDSCPRHAEQEILEKIGNSQVEVAVVKRFKNSKCIGVIIYPDTNHLHITSNEFCRLV